MVINRKKKLRSTQDAARDLGQLLFIAIFWQRKCLRRTYRLSVGSGFAFGVRVI